MVCPAGYADCHSSCHPVLLPIYSKLDIDTAYHYLELRFKSKGLRVLGAVMFIVYQIRTYVYYHVSAVHGACQSDRHQCEYSYYRYGRYRNYLFLHRLVVNPCRTDFIQGSVLLVGVTFALIFLVAHIDGGMGSIFDAFAAGNFIGARSSRGLISIS